MNDKSLHAFMNHGRWLFRCPRCGTAHEAQAGGMVCGVCWPGTRAKLLEPVGNGMLRPVPDVETIAGAIAGAREKGEWWVPIFPADKEAIEAVLRERPLPQNMNWIPSETLADLCEQNIAHGAPLPKKNEGREITHAI